MGWARSDELGCKKHPKHRQSPGVCSICLREKLAQLSSAKICDAASSYFMSSSLSSVASSSGGSASSSYSSPISYDVIISSSTTSATTTATKKASGQVSLLVSGKDGLHRSRSMAIIGARKRLDDQEYRVDPAIIDKNHRKIKINKGGFWSRLLKSSSKMKKEQLMHSKTMKEAKVTRLV